MAKAPKKIKEVKAAKSKRVKPSAQESLKRMAEFKQRKEKFVATVREGKD